MREKLQDAPWWVWSLIEGVFFGAVMTVYFHLQQSSSWTAAAIGGLVSGVAFGAVMGPMIAGRRRRVFALVGDLPSRDLRIAARAVNRGPAPLDPNTRQVAVLLATQQLGKASLLRWVGLPLWVLATVLYAFFAFTDSPWWWMAAAASVTLGALFLMWPRHLQRRLKILSQDA